MNAASPFRQSDVFRTTCWSIVQLAGCRSSPDSDRALSELCQIYWYPLYGYIRRQGYTKEDAEDLVQSFFARFLEGNYLGGLMAERGRFRAFLLAALKHFLANEWDRIRAHKRGGRVEHLSLNWRDAEDRVHLDPPDPTSPERSFDRDWAMALLDRVIGRLDDEYSKAGKSALFTHAKVFLVLGNDRIPYVEVAKELGLEEGTLRVAVHRLRKRYRAVLREEIAQTLTEPGQVAEELRSLFVALAG